MEKHIQRTFGWIQNPGKLDNLKRVVGLFVKDSSINKQIVEYRLPLIRNNRLMSDKDYELILLYLNQDSANIPYSVLKGRGSEGNSRANAKCSGLAQMAIDAQSTKEYVGLDGKPIRIKKPYTDDWSADGFLRWGVSTGLLNYDRATDSVSLTELGKELAFSVDGSMEEKTAFAKALMAYPPVQRVLSILLSDQSTEGLTKFEIGSSLGFVGELGFTSINQGYYLALLSSAQTSAEKAAIRSNIEGDSDKYARMIAGWLVKMNWLETASKLATGAYRGVNYQEELLSYKITAAGEAAFRSARGNSRNPKMPKIVLYEMLATKVPDAEYVRRRRALIIQSLGKPTTIAEVLARLSANGLSETAATVEDDIRGLQNIGIFVSKDERTSQYSIDDKIAGLSIPARNSTRLEKSDITTLKDQVRSKLKHISHNYLVLIDLAFSCESDKQKKNSDARDFEIYTADLLTKELSFRGGRFGDSNRPDVLVWKDKEGIIIDNKSYAKGLAIERKNEDEMSRYIEQAQMMIPGQPDNEWWREFSENGVCNLSYLFVTSFLKVGFRKNLVSLYARRGVKGGAIGVDNLLYLAEKIKRGDLEEIDVPSLFNNDEVVISL